MNAVFEKRKKELLDWLAVEYAPKKNAWWKEPLAEYTSTDFFKKVKLPAKSANEIVEIKNSLSLQLFMFIFLLAFTLIVLFVSPAWPKIIFGLIPGALCIYCSKNLFDRNTKIKLDKDGIWHYKINIVIAWKFVAASYIKSHRPGKTTQHWLIVHYYDPAIQIFEIAEMDISSLDMNYDKIASLVEYFKSAAQDPPASVDEA